MKNIFKILAGAVILTAFASCKLNHLPSFDDADSFVAVDITAIIVDETAGTVTIPVTIASIEPIKTAVTYEVVEGTAKKGVHFDLQDESGVLTFDGKTRTQNIVLNIINKVGEYTGDVSFSVNLLNAGKTVKLGADVSCSVRIGDLDHPLAAILGAYSAKGYSYFDDVEESWTLDMYKDDNDVKVVWIDGIIPLLSGRYPASDYRVYGNVSEDMQTISIPAGQVLKDNISGNTVSLWTFNGSSVSKSGVLEFKYENGAWVLKDVGYGIGYESSAGVSLYGLYNPDSISWTKK